MSYLLFLDESGHDRRTMPYEVRGGMALHAEKLWPFIQRMRSMEEAAFGDLLQHYGAEIKGHHLLDKERFKWAAQGDLLDDTARRKYALSFLDKGVQKKGSSHSSVLVQPKLARIGARGITRHAYPDVPCLPTGPALVRPVGRRGRRSGNPLQSASAQDLMARDSPLRVRIRTRKYA